ncbi:hypothetical protein [Marinobacterium aestuariivivens]|uniref:Uncharacterized protein n=1 Tax=Marinobacterium aestuariivivens TaxID=1698799 RepID=A0ABW2AA55_9GAMM
MQDSIKLRNPYSLDETLEKLRHYLTAIQRPEALSLLEKADSKAKAEEDYARQMESALLNGSTIECRELFSAFGDYWARTHDEIPCYRHHDAVNLIDSAIYHIKLGDSEDAIEFFNLMHNQP